MASCEPVPAVGCGTGAGICRTSHLIPSHHPSVPRSGDAEGANHKRKKFMQQYDMAAHKWARLDSFCRRAGREAAERPLFFNPEKKEVDQVLLLEYVKIFFETLGMTKAMVKNCMSWLQATLNEQAEESGFKVGRAYIWCIPEITGNLKSFKAPPGN